ncbi:MAG: UDP-N-acetylglucosamine 1-carboxyvinyltransferase [Tenericutes bacterium]|jgi:UDP-N-acetylglucosamine 1-carboxyvinyltransferase|nr:UDP-N-acetylglucosamine 1-carboxyvinyltransferase [Mycoplasmatota bacterium]
MKVLQIKGGKELSGEIVISGAKNSAVALIPAAILADEPIKILNVPQISDIDALSDSLKYLGASVTRTGETFIIDPKSLINKPIPENISNKLRASYYFMGALLGKYKEVDMFFPGGCAIGSRPINLHLKGFEALGAKIEEKGNRYHIYAKELKGTNIYLDFASVGATINIMLAATRAKGKTIIDNAAKEPEIVNIAIFLNNMGAKIKGAGTSTITIIGVDHLKGCFHEVIPDRIEAGTYVILGALVGNKLKISNLIPEHIEALLSKLKEAGVEMEIGDDHIIISKPNKYKSISIVTQIYPGFPTDLQQPITPLLTQCPSASITENIFENRFMHIKAFNKLGGKIKINGKKAIFKGPCQLKGTKIEATDLRAGAAMVLAGLIAKDITIITNIEHILRGYEGIVEKLINVGAKIEVREI